MDWMIKSFLEQFIKSLAYSICSVRACGVFSLYWSVFFIWKLVLSIIFKVRDKIIGGAYIIIFAG